MQVLNWLRLASVNLTSFKETIQRFLSTCQTAQIQGKLHLRLWE